MSDVKTLVFPESSGGGSGMLGMLAPLLQKNGLDPNMVFAMMNGKGNNGFGGEGGWFMWVIFLFFLMGWGNWGGNGFGNRGGDSGSSGLAGIPNLINNDNGRELLMQAIQGNGTAISQLSSTLNCSIGQIQQSINQVMGVVQGVGNQVGMSAQQIINSIQSGNCQIAQQIAQCCCEQRLSICQQTNTLQNTMNQNTLALRDAGTSNTNAIISKLDQMQNQALLDKIDALREKNTQLTTQLSQEHQNAYFAQVSAQTIAPVNAALADLSSRLASIECKQPPTVNVPYVPAMGSMIPVNYSVPVNFGVSPQTACGC